MDITKQMAILAIVTTTACFANDDDACACEDSACCTEETAVAAVEETTQEEVTTQGDVTTQEEMPIVNLDDATNEDLDRMCQGELVIEMSVGSIFEAGFTVSNSLLDFVSPLDDGSFETVQAFYLKEEGDQLLFSTDLETWTSCEATAAESIESII